MGQMDEFETRLRGLRLRVPSEELDQRILKAKSEETGTPRFGEAAAPENVRPAARRLARRVPLWAAMAASLAMAIGGFAAGRSMHSDRAAISPPAAPVAVQVIYHCPSSRNPFDFTCPPDPPLPGKIWTTAGSTKGV